MSAEMERVLQSGRLAESEGNVREAVVRYEAAVKLAANDARPRLRLGTLCHRIRDYARAREALEEASRIDPDDADVAFRLGLTCDALGDRELARAAYARTMMLAPTSWRTWYLIGRDHRQLIGGGGSVVRRDVVGDLLRSGQSAVLRAERRPVPAGAGANTGAGEDQRSAQRSQRDHE